MVVLQLAQNACVKMKTVIGSPGESVQYASTWRCFEESHWRSEYGKRHPLV